MTQNKKIQSYKKRIEELPIFCKCILIISILIACITIGFSLGIVINKDKLQSRKDQIEYQKKQEELKLDTFLKTRFNNDTHRTVPQK